MEGVGAQGKEGIKFCHLATLQVTPPPFPEKVPPPTKKKPAAPLPPSPMPRASKSAKVQQSDFEEPNREEQEMDELLQKVRQQEMALSREMAE